MFERDRDREQDRPSGQRPEPTAAASAGRGEPAPEIKRPRGATWRRLEAEGIVWEGQVVLVGEESDLAARLIVTKRRLAFVRGGAVALDLGREWLTPPPLLLPDGTLGLSITLDGGTTENLFVQAREGRRVAGHLVTLLGGSGVRRPLPAGTGRPSSARAAVADGRAYGLDSTRAAEALTSGLPGPLFPDDLAGSGPGAGRSTFSAGLPTRPDPSPPRPYEPAWARPRRDRLDAWDNRPVRPDDFSHPRDAWSEPLEPPERVTALVPDEQSVESPHRRRFTDAAIEVLSPATAFGSTRPRPTREAAQIVPAPAPPTKVGRHSDWNLQPMRGIAPRDARRRRRQEWLARLLGLMVFAVIALAVTAQTGIPLPGGNDDGERLPAATVGPSPAAVAQVPPTATTAPTATIAAPAPGTNVIDVAAQTAEAIGVGGPSATETEESVSAPTSAAPALADTIGGGGATEDAGGDLAAAAADEPTEVPTTAPAAPTATERPAPTPTPEGTDPPTAAPTATDEPAPTATATATEQPTIARAVETDAAGLPAVDDADDAQAPSLATGEVANQTFVSGPFRFSIVGAVRSPSVPALGLYDYGTGEWVALFADVVNWSLYPATLNMPEFVLSDGSREAPITLDTGSALIARTAGLEAAYVHDALVPYAPGEQHRVLLLYLVAPEAFDLTLRTNEAAVELDDMLAGVFDPADLPAEEPLAPDMVQAFVTAVIDGQTIEVDVNGELHQVRYLGIDVPVNTDCWALESTQANINLVIGQLVWLERQRSNADRQGRLLRDVWVLGWDGYFDLVAERLVAQGAAEPATTVPNTRLSEWLEASSADAAAVGFGRWGFCPIGDGEIGIEPVLAILLPFLIGMAWVVLGTPGLDLLSHRRSTSGGQAKEQPPAIHQQSD